MEEEWKAYPKQSLEGIMGLFYLRGKYKSMYGYKWKYKQ